MCTLVTTKTDIGLNCMRLASAKAKFASLSAAWSVSVGTLMVSVPACAVILATARLCVLIDGGSSRAPEARAIKCIGMLISDGHVL